MGLTKTNFRKASRLFALCLGLLLFGNVSAWAQALKTVKIGIPGDSLGFGSYYIAQEAGLFTAEGIKAEFNNISADIIPAALSTGDIDIAPLIGSVTRARIAGYKLTAVALLVDKPPFGLVSKKEIASVAGLKGKTIISGPANATPGVIVKFLLEKAGLSPQTDVQLLPIGPISGRVTMMRSGQADSVILSGSDALDIVAKMDSLKILVPPKDMPAQLIDGVGVADAMLARDPETIRKVIRALAKANMIATSDPDRSGGLLAKYLKKPGLEKEIGRMFADSVSDGILPTLQLYESEAYFASVGLGKQVTATQIQSAWDLRIAREVEAELKKR
jgi:NitT/TauT family transport system substrate-binding protein